MYEEEFDHIGYAAEGGAIDQISDGAGEDEGNGAFCEGVIKEAILGKKGGEGDGSEGGDEGKEGGPVTKGRESHTGILDIGDCEDMRNEDGLGAEGDGSADGEF